MIRLGQFDRKYVGSWFDAIDRDDVRSLAEVYRARHNSGELGVSKKIAREIVTDFNELDKDKYGIKDVADDKVSFSELEELKRLANDIAARIKLH